MKFYNKYFMSVFMFLTILSTVSVGAQEVRDEIKDERDELMEETQIKVLSLASQYVVEDLILISCQTFTFMLTYGELANIEVPSWQNFKQFLVDDILQDTNRNGVALESTWDKEMIRDVMQTVETIESVSGYGLQLVINDGEVKVYIAPELNGGDTGADRSGGLVSYLGEQNVDGRSLLGLYGGAAAEPHGQYVAERNADTSRSIDILTNIFRAFNGEQIEKYLQYYNTVRELVGGEPIESIGGAEIVDIIDEIEGVDGTEEDPIQNAQLTEIVDEINTVIQSGVLTEEETEAYVAEMIEYYMEILEGLELDSEEIEVIEVPETETENDEDNGTN